MRMRTGPIALLLLLGLMAASVDALNPSRTYKQRPEKFNMAYEEVSVPTEDGALLNAWDFAPNVKSTRLILLSHNGEGNMGDYLRRIAQFTAIGYRVVIYDYRGFGKSSEFEIDNNMYIYPHFQADLRAMIDYCRKTHVKTFDLYGWGVGAGLTLGVGWHRPEARRIVADTPFFSMEDLEARFSSWDEPMEVPFAGYEKKSEPIHALAAPPKGVEGVLLIIGSNDVLYSVADMQRLAKKQKTTVRQQIHIVENPDRKSNYRVDSEKYFAAIQSFLSD